MKKLLSLIAIATALTLSATAAEGEKENKDKDAAKGKSSLTAEQKAVRKELMAKYDANKNGYLDKEEQSKMTPEEQEKWNSIAAAAKEKKAGTKKPE